MKNAKIPPYSFINFVVAYKPEGWNFSPDSNPIRLLRPTRLKGNAVESK